MAKKTIDNKPVCKLIGTDGNIFALVGAASQTLKKAGKTEKAKELSDRLFSMGSYDEALQLIMEYVDIE